MSNSTISRPYGLYISKNIAIEVYESTPSDFLDKVQQAIKEIRLGEVGERLLTRIGEGKHIVCIKYELESDETVYENEDNAQTKGVGSNSTIYVSGNSDIAVGYQGDSIAYPFYMILAHELIHAYHASYGKVRLVSEDIIEQKNLWTDMEEHKTIIGNPSKNPMRNRSKIHENAIRKEHHLPLRYSHINGKNLSKKESSEIKMTAQSHQIQSIFNQQIFGENPFGVPLLGKIHQVSKGSFFT